MYIIPFIYACVRARMVYFAYTIFCFLYRTEKVEKMTIRIPKRNHKLYKVYKKRWVR